MEKYLSILFITLLITGCSLNSLFFKDKSYALSIEMDSCVVADIQMSCGSSIDNFVVKQREEDAAESGLYYLIKLKNKGNKRAWGELVFEQNGKQFATILFNDLPPNMQDYIVCLVPVDSRVVLFESFRVKTYWRELYSK